MTNAALMNNKTLLIADDEEPIRRLFRRVAEKDGWIVDEAPDCGTMIDLLESGQSKPSAIVLDMNMPCDSGVHALTHLEELGANVGIVVVSGDPSVHHRMAHRSEKTPNLNVVAVGAKPISNKDLLHCLDLCTARARSATAS